MEKIHFSVVTVVRKDLDGLKKTRESLDAQKHKNWTHIIVDGDSRDGTKKYLESLPSQNTIYISERDSGIYNAMNKGWRLAQDNSFVYYLNARDVFATSVSLTKAASALRGSVDGMWGCTTHEEINEDGTGWVCKLVSPPSIPNQLFAFGYRSHQGVVMRKEIIETLSGFDESYRLAADWDLIVRAMLNSTPVVWIHPLGRFELGGESSKNIYRAHMELRSIRRNYLPRSISARFFDEIWCAYYLNHLGYSSIISKLLQRFLSFKVKKFQMWRFTLLPRTRYIQINLGFITIGLHLKGLNFFHKSKKRSRPVKTKRNFRFEITNLLIHRIHKGLGILPYESPHSVAQLKPNKDT